MTFANILESSTDFWGAFLNILGIIGIIAIAIFLVVFVSDWILSTMSDRQGIFFKKHKNDNTTVTNNTTNITNNYAEREPVVEKEEEKGEEVDFEKARQEEAQAKQEFVFDEPAQPEPEPVVEAKPVEPDYDAMIEEINNDALSAYGKVKSEEFARQVLQTNEVRDDEEKPAVVEDETDDFEDISFNDEDEDVFEDEPVEEEQPKVEETKEPTEEEKQVQNEILRRLEEQVAELQKQLQAQQQENEELKRIAEEEKAKLNELIAKRNGDDDDEGRRMKDYVGNLDELEARLENLKERLKTNEKELRINKKEYIPLSRVKKTLESDKKKLRRREAIVAKRKVLLYGVNNYADIDEEKAKELNEELDLLEGLRLSVAHCEEVMEANKDRYPILEQTNKILTETNSQIKSDIEQVEKDIELAKKMQNEEN